MCDSPGSEKMSNIQNCDVCKVGKRKGGGERNSPANCIMVRTQEKKCTKKQGEGKP